MLSSGDKRHLQNIQVSEHHSIFKAGNVFNQSIKKRAQAGHGRHSPLFKSQFSSSSKQGLPTKTSKDIGDIEELSNINYIN